MTPTQGDDDLDLAVRLDHQPTGARPDRGLLLAGSPHPLLSWTPPETGGGPSIELRVAGGPSIWTAAPATDATGIRIDAELAPFTRYVARFEVRGAAVEVPFETGPLRTADWTAPWLAVPPGHALVMEFDAATAETARLWITAQGLVLAQLNGMPVNPGRLDPSRTDRQRALYRGFDVSDLLRSGANRLEVVVGRGEWHRAGIDPRVLVELSVVRSDGSLRRIAPSEGARLVTSRIAIDDPFYLERHDPAAAGRAASMPAATLPAGAASDIPVPAAVLPDTGPRIAAIGRFEPVEVGRGPGWRTFDVGTNIAGRSRVRVAGLAPGTIVSAIHGEHLDAAGRVDTTNISMPYDRGRERQRIELVVPDGGEHELAAWFAYHGFRYVEVRGADEAIVSIAAEAVHSDLPDRSRVESDAAEVVELVARGRRTALNVLHGVPEDCPTREQSAWTGDVASAADYLFSALDMGGFAAKWLADLVTSTGPDGALPAIAPDIREERVPGEPNWGAALHRVLAAHWLHAGDDEVLERTLPALRAWAEHQLARIGETGVVDRFGISYGHDWLALEQTPPPLLHTAATIDCVETLAWLERESGSTDAAAAWEERASALRAAARRAFVRPGPDVANGSQGSLAVALAAGLLHPDEVEPALDALERAIREGGQGATTGFALTRTLVETLGRHGRSQVVADLLRQTDAPGIGAMIAHGPGTFWENWWIDPANTGTGSLDHLGLGAPYAAWVWRYLAGIRPTARGWSRFVVQPAFVDGAGSIRVDQSTPRGRAAVSWVRDGLDARLRVEVPAGSEALLRLEGDDEVLGPGVHERTARLGAEPARRPIAHPAWAAPAIAARPADVDGERDLLRDARVLPRPGSVLEERARLVCMPVPHAQTGAPVLRVGAEDPDAGPGVRIEPARPVALDGVRFVYVLVDQCERGDWSRSPTLTLLLDDGAILSATGTAWPAGWNRVAVDLDDAPPGRRLVAVEVGLEGSPGPDEPVSFHLGELGVSSRDRAW